MEFFIVFVLSAPGCLCVSKNLSTQYWLCVSAIGGKNKNLKEKRLKPKPIPYYVMKYLVKIAGGTIIIQKID